MILEDTTLVGLLPKNLTDQQLDAPTTVVEISLKMIQDAIAGGVINHSLPNFQRASVMRVGYSNVVIGLVTVPMPKDLARSENNFMAGENGFIVVYLTVDADACRHAVVHDVGESPIKFIHYMWKLGSASAVRYDVGLRRFDPVLYKEKAVTAFPDDESEAIEAWVAYKQSDEGRADKNGSIVVARKSGARGLIDARIRIKIGNGAKRMPERIHLEERVPVFISGPDEDDLVTVYSPCVTRSAGSLPAGAVGACAGDLPGNNAQHTKTS